MKNTTLNEAYEDKIDELRNHGSLVNTKTITGSSRVVEVLNDTTTFNNPYYIKITNEKRKANVKYAILEFMWYLSKDTRIGNIGKAASIWKDIANSDGRVSSNYGPSLHLGWDRTINELTRFPDSRRAVIPIYDGKRAEWYDIKDVPCTMFVQFLIRDNKLHMVWNMRSSDLIFGFCNDIAVGMLFMQMMHNELCDYDVFKHLKLGDFTYNTSSLHIYDTHWDLLWAPSEELFSNISEEKYELKARVTWDKLMEDGMLLSTKDITIEQIYESVDRFMELYIVGGDFMT